jgi:ABC-2 type transport system ATP-binding protein
MSWLIETSGLTKSFESLMAVKDVSLRVAEGEIMALLGPNGAGKTTTIRMLASILRPSSGWARISGHSVVDEPLEVRRRVGLLTEHHGLYTRMQARSYLRYFGSLYSLDTAGMEGRIEKQLHDFGLLDVEHLRLGQYSRGMRQKLALARALLHDPSVLLLDEPTSAMDPASAKLVRRSIAGLRSGRRGIVVCTHNLSEAEMLADRIAIIRRGEIIALGSPAELKQRLLGDPIMEVRVSHNLNGQGQDLPKGAEAIDRGESWIRYRTSDPAATNPQVIRHLQSAGAEVVTLTEVGRSLEDVYLEVVEAADRGEASA